MQEQYQALFRLTGLRSLPELNLLLSEGVDLSPPINEDGDTILHIVAKRCNALEQDPNFLGVNDSSVAILKSLISNASEDALNRLNHAGQTFLNILLQGSYDMLHQELEEISYLSDIIKFTVDASGIDLSIAEQGYEAARWAAHHNKFDIVKYLVDKGVGTIYKSDIKDLFAQAVKLDYLSDDNDPVLYVKYETTLNLRDLVKYMAEKGVEGLDYRDDRGANVLFIAIEERISFSKIETLDLLYKHGVNPRDKDFNGNNFAHYICTCMQYESIAEFIPFARQHGVDFNEKNNEGQTVLSYEYHQALFTLVKEVNIDLRDQKIFEWFDDACSKEDAYFDNETMYYAQYMPYFNEAVAFNVLKAANKILDKKSTAYQGHNEKIKLFAQNFAILINKEFFGDDSPNITDPRYTEIKLYMYIYDQLDGNEEMSIIKLQDFFSMLSDTIKRAEDLQQEGIVDSNLLEPLLQKFYRDIPGILNSELTEEDEDSYFKIKECVKKLRTIEILQKQPNLNIDKKQELSVNVDKLVNEILIIKSIETFNDLLGEIKDLKEHLEFISLIYSAEECIKKLLPDSLPKNDLGLDIIEYIQTIETVISLLQQHSEANKQYNFFKLAKKMDSFENHEITITSEQQDIIKMMATIKPELREKFLSTFMPPIFQDVIGDSRVAHEYNDENKRKLEDSTDPSAKRICLGVDEDNQTDTA